MLAFYRAIQVPSQGSLLKWLGVIDTPRTVRAAGRSTARKGAVSSRTTSGYLDAVIRFGTSALSTITWDPNRNSIMV